MGLDDVYNILKDILVNAGGTVGEGASTTPASVWTYSAAAGGISNTTTAVTIKAAGAVGVKNYVKSMQINWGTLGAGTEIVLRKGAAGTVLWRGVATTAAGSIDVPFETPVSSDAAQLLEVATLTATVTGGVYVNAQGYEAP